ncbi:MAG: DUF5677 domain-containing protein [Rhodospirillales bacterium]|jgi:hypothetical protein|nr:DUF5677 domain-containing protein [Magnetospirillum sp.]
MATIDFRADPRFSGWFALADELLKFSTEVMLTSTVKLSDDSKLLSWCAFAQCRETFESTLWLAERGKVNDVRSLARTAAERAIAIRAINKDGQFLEKMASDFRSKRKNMAATLREGERADWLNAENTKKVVEFLQSLANETADGLKWEAIARENQLDHLYQMVYRPLSNDGVHCTLDSLQRHVVKDEHGRVKELRYGPDDEGIDDALRASCTAMMFALEGMCEAFPRPGGDEKMRSLLAQYKKLDGTPESTGGHTNK